MTRRRIWGVAAGVAMAAYGILVMQATMRARVMVRDWVGGGEVSVAGVVFPFGVGTAVLGMEVVRDMGDGVSQNVSCDFLWLSGISPENGRVGRLWSRNLILVHGTDTLSLGTLDLEGGDLSLLAEPASLPLQPFFRLQVREGRLAMKGDVAGIGGLDMTLDEQGRIVSGSVSGADILQVSGNRSGFSRIDFSGGSWLWLARMAGAPVSARFGLPEAMAVYDLVFEENEGIRISCSHCRWQEEVGAEGVELVTEGLSFRFRTGSGMADLIPDGLSGNARLRVTFDRGARVLGVNPARLEIEGGAADVLLSLGNVPEADNLLAYGGITLLEFSAGVSDAGFLRDVLARRAKTLGLSMETQAENLVKGMAGLAVWRDSGNRGLGILVRELQPFLADPDGIEVSFRPAKPVPVLAMATALSLQPDLVLALLERGSLELARKRR